MSIKLNELAAGTKAKFQEAIADGRITAEEWEKFSKDEQELLSQGLGGKTPTVGDDIVIKTTKTTKPKETTKQERAELSWGEIGKQGLKSVGKFFKGMFCDEDGFSLKRTATTIGMGLGFAVLAVACPPAALTAGAAMGGYMVYEGGKNLIEGTEEYYNATTHEEAVAAMEKAMDGGVETAGGVAALFGVKKGYSKYKASKAQANPAPQPEPQTNPQPKVQSEPSVQTKQSPQSQKTSSPKTEQKPAPKAEQKPTAEVKTATENKAPTDVKPQTKVTSDYKYKMNEPDGTVTSNRIVRRSDGTKLLTKNGRMTGANVRENCTQEFDAQGRMIRQWIQEEVLGKDGKWHTKHTTQIDMEYQRGGVLETIANDDAPIVTQFHKGAKGNIYSILKMN